MFLTTIDSMLTSNLYSNAYIYTRPSTLSMNYKNPTKLTERLVICSRLDPTPS